jgi:hypothetical protein
MSRTLGVAESKADIDSGTITGVTTLTVASGGTAQFFTTAAAIAQPSGSAQAALATTAATTGAATYGLTSAQANGVITLLNEIRSSLVNLGLIKGS